MMMKSILVNLKEEKVLEYQLEAHKLGISLEEYTGLILTRLSVEDIEIDASALLVTGRSQGEKIMSPEKYQTLKNDILSDYAELYKRLA